MPAKAVNEQYETLLMLHRSTPEGGGGPEDGETEMHAFQNMTIIDRAIDRFGVGLLVALAVFAPLSALAFFAAL